ncbi:B3/B4 domain-containing protein (DNA/RNA-binding domain of Phe-tRNA-synthetase) [Geosporobacter subterraneus DSM 17957]|uniref:B3/B4 domain-containing protein (DNA/RNA-binding domain of Phe-tRNA-synthetase) n=1 Tax=Geosporobacter subterraneus DSM 17957 TaxID=1121919 RepID=A0A1M6I7U1_9FIRM|nr:phenylalanine--tRNA ligase beta subunit-related protein [Geosporobacter subterraneus]SHJ30468.1 B3/B4 domain-containing protein (DNA/RNA-binding domain of Phe-tRNA-synthetase) [Geosporobacter subterraneus DSM 17957]
MRKFIVEDDFWKLFPKAQIGIIIARDINNHKNAVNYEPLIEKAGQEALKQIGDIELAKHPAIAVWREAYKNFRAPKQNRSSIEALIRRVYNGKSIGSINPLVDIYNIISLQYLLPCGGEDLESVQGDMRLTAASGDELFVPLGQTENDPPNPGEIIYRDDAGGICRCWNWREADRTKLTENTREAILVIECIDGSREALFKEAVTSLAKLIQEHLGGEQKIRFLNNEMREACL